LIFYLEIIDFVTKYQLRLCYKSTIRDLKILIYDVSETLI